MRRMLRKLWLAVPLGAVLLVGCDLDMAYNDDVEGWYSYAGTVDDEPGYSVNGEIYIYAQYDDRHAEADVDWYMYEGGRKILDIRAEEVPVYIDRDGRISFDVIGDLQLASGRWTEFVLRHEGRVRGSRMYGDWDLETDAPSYDQGRFNASR